MTTARRTSRTAQHVPVQRVLVRLLVFAAFVVAALRAPPLLLPYAGVPTIELAPTGDRPREEVVADRVALTRVPVARPSRGSDPSSTAGSGDLRFRALQQASVAELVSRAHAMGSGVGASALKTWAPGAPLRAELMVYLN